MPDAEASRKRQIQLRRILRDLSVQRASREAGLTAPASGL
jgi:hypothetical protein